MRRKRAREQAAKEQAAAEAAAATALPAGRRTVSAPAASGSTTPGSAPAVPNAAVPNPAAAAPLPPDRVDALTEAIGGELGRLRGEIRGRDADLVQALQQVAASYDRVAARLDDERRVQTLLAEALVRIDRRLASIERRGSAAAAVEGPATDTPAIEGPSNPTQAADGPAPRSQRVIGGSIAPRQDIPRLDR